MNRAGTEAWLAGILPAGLEVFQGGAFHVGVAKHEGQVIATTTDFGRVDTGLSSADGMDVRSELFTVAELPEAALIDAVRVLGTAANQLLSTQGPTAAQPGKLLPHLGAAAGLSDYTVAHGLLVSPFMWGEQVPQLREPAGEVSGAGVTPDTGRLTLMLQLLMITEEELKVFLRGGPGELIAALVGGQVPVLDWHR